MRECRLNFPNGNANKKEEGEHPSDGVGHPGNMQSQENKKKSFLSHPKTQLAKDSSWAKGASIGKGLRLMNSGWGGEKGGTSGVTNRTGFGNRTFCKGWRGKKKASGGKG